MIRKPRPGSQTPTQPEPHPLAHLTLATLTARLGEIRDHQKRILREIIRLEKASIIASEIEGDRAFKLGAAAIEMLAGNNEHLFALQTLADAHQKLTQLRRAHRIIIAALEVGEAQLNVLSLNERAKREAAHRPQYREDVRGVWKALIELDKAQAKRDKGLRDVQVPGDQPAGIGWIFGGRLAHNESTVYRFGRVCVDSGFISEAEFQQAYEEAKQRDPRFNDKA